mmetsp:Transcript_25140/g.56757  ORF Transcript_25140/g.56757 Transcript_25140/m.56757 type:complete len:203 (-) Transcript_25140:133-741(-)
MRSLANPPVYPREDGTPSITPGQGLYVSEDQHRPELLFTTLARTCGSIPSLLPRLKASHTPVIVMPSTRLLQIFATCPLPLPPQCTMFLPMAARTGRDLVRARSSPPTMNVRVAFCAPIVPPETGASMNSWPLPWQTSESSRAHAGSTVLQSMKRTSFLLLARRPSLRKYASFTCLPAGSMVITVSILSVSSAGQLAAVAPC